MHFHAFPTEKMKATTWIAIGVCLFTAAVVFADETTPEPGKYLLAHADDQMCARNLLCADSAVQGIWQQNQVVLRLDVSGCGIEAHFRAAAVCFCASEQSIRRQRC